MLIYICTAGSTHGGSLDFSVFIEVPNALMVGLGVDAFDLSMQTRDRGGPIAARYQAILVSALLRPTASPHHTRLACVLIGAADS